MTTEEFFKKTSAIKAIVGGLDCDMTLSLFAMVTAQLSDAESIEGRRINWLKATAKLTKTRHEIEEGD